MGHPATCSRLEGRVALVTGAARGIGQAYAVGRAVQEGAGVAAAEVLDCSEKAARVRAVNGKGPWQTIVVDGAFDYPLEGVMGHPRYSKRAVLVAPNEPIETVVTELPPPEAGGAIVAVEMGGVCGSDVHFWRGRWPLEGPIVLGHEGVGRLAALGGGSETDYAGEPIEVGDLVYWTNQRPCHRCYWCTIGGDVTLCARLGEVFFTRPDAPSHSTYNDYAYLWGGLPFFRIPDGVPAEAVIAFGCALPTMLQAFDRLGPIRLGESVVVQGAGPVGLAATLIATISGAGQVVVIGAPAERLALARELGADLTLDIAEVRDSDTRVREARRWLGRGADVVIEATGVLDAFDEGLRLLEQNGRYAVVGLWSGAGTVPLDPRTINNGNLRVVGSALCAPRHYYRAVRLVERFHRRFPLAEAVTHRFRIEEAQGALEAVERGEPVKAVIVPV